MSYEFKGTKGKWEIEFVGIRKYIKSGSVYIANLSFGNEEKKANSLIISKAPEMLEMLKRVLEINNHHKFNGHLINEDLEKLIKEVTEI